MSTSANCTKTAEVCASVCASTSLAVIRANVPTDIVWLAIIAPAKVNDEMRCMEVVLTPGNFKLNFKISTNASDRECVVRKRLVSTLGAVTTATLSSARPTTSVTPSTAST